LNILSENTKGPHGFRDFNISRFENAALEMFRSQYAGNSVYRQFVDTLQEVRGEAAASFPSPASLTDIPFLPIRFFKTHRVATGDFTAAIRFTSSGTTQTGESSHFVKDLGLYEQSFMEGFRLFYGDIRNYCVLALLPAYLEREGSSLVYMADVLIRASGHPQSGFYLSQFEQLASTLLALEASGQPTILLGVTFALLDFAEAFPLALNHTIVMETGGMKGRKKELTREEVHGFLKERWGLREVHAEYGMTELLSQAYSKGGGRFFCPPWMRVLLRGEDDPLSLTLPEGTARKEGLINIIDLANQHSCAFIATDDLGRLYPNGSFEVIGRMDNADLRGCSLLTA
jgi:hypothetical protein